MVVPMTRLIPIARVLLGLVFVTFSLNFFLHFLPQPSSVPPDAMVFAGALMTSGFLTFIKIVELVAGLALLANRFTTLALALLAPIIVGITLFHALLEPSGMPLALVVLALELFLAWSYRAAYAPMLRARVTPVAPAREPAVELARASA
jgi:putative oxidoreductase